MRGHATAGVLAILFLSSCATVGEGVTGAMLEPLEQALTVPVSDLTDRVLKGEARAQYALSLVYRYGLQGQAASREKADRLQRAAREPRRFDTVSKPIHYGDGSRGSYLMEQPHYDVTLFEMLAIDRCAEALNAGKSDEATQRKCGGAVRFDRLKALWRAGR